MTNSRKQKLISDHNAANGNHANERYGSGDGAGSTSNLFSPAQILNFIARKFARLSWNVIEEQAGEAAHKMTATASSLVDSFSEEIANLVVEMEVEKNIEDDEKNNKHLNRANFLQQETDKLLNSMSLFSKEWNTSTNSKRKIITSGIEQLCNDFLLDYGQWNSNKCIQAFLFTSPAKNPSVERTTALNFLKLYEAGHQLLLLANEFPDTTTLNYQKLMIAVFRDFHRDIDLKSVLYPLNKRWNWI